MIQIRSKQIYFAILLLSSVFTSQVHSRNVFCHYMIGNSYLSNSGTMANDIQIASSAGIDGFALNIGPDVWQPDRVSQMFSAASGFSYFKLFFSFDMSVMSDVSTLISYVEQYHSHPNSFYYNGRYFVSTFAGQDLTFGEDNVNDGWQRHFKDPLSQAGINVYFVPSWTALGPINVFENNPVLDGMFSWAAWPTTDSTMNTDEDLLYMSDARKNGKTYMAGVSPWFFTHFSYKNWIYKSETLWPNRWQEMISLKPDLIEIITWNDFGESSYVGPIEGAMPAGSEQWVMGYTHQPWLNMASYFITAYKTGSYPAITTDQVYYWYRTTSKYTQCSDPLGQPQDYDWADDNIVVFALLTSPATIIVNSGSATSNFNGNQGSNLFQMAFQQGTVTITLQRNGQTLASQQGALSIGGCGSGYNFNAWVGQLNYGAISA